MTTVAVLDHGMGNLRSVAKALAAAGATVNVSADARRIEASDALCVPGQGIFGRCADALAGAGLDDVVRDWTAAQRPYLGICLGMQILFEGSEEDPEKSGLGVLGGRAVRLPDSVPVPHIGWNTVNESYFYFDHSFGVVPEDEAIVDGWCEHGRRFAASIRTGSITGVQFHPEKSSSAGVALLRGWLDTL